MNVKFVFALDWIVIGLLLIGVLMGFARLLTEGFWALMNLVSLGHCLSILYESRCLEFMCLEIMCQLKSSASGKW